MVFKSRDGNPCIYWEIKKFICSQFLKILISIKNIFNRVIKVCKSRVLSPNRVLKPWQSPNRGVDNSQTPINRGLNCCQNLKSKTSFDGRELTGVENVTKSYHATFKPLVIFCSIKWLVNSALINKWMSMLNNLIVCWLQCWDSQKWLSIGCRDPVVRLSLITLLNGKDLRSLCPKAVALICALYFSYEVLRSSEDWLTRVSNKQNTHLKHIFHEF